MTGHEVNAYLVVSPTTARPYRGVDRQPWETIAAAYYAHTLPNDLARIYADMRASSARSLWWPSTTSLEHAVALLEFTRASERHAELIAVYSPYLRQVIGREAWTDREATLLGTDVIAVGEWSLLDALGQLEIPLPADVPAHINEWGLLRDGSTALRVEAYYRQLSAENRVEPIADAAAGLPVEPTPVFLVHV